MKDKCNDCNGSGADETNQDKCPECKGRGTKINFQTRICPTCHDDHSSETACDINDILQLEEVRKIYEEPMRIVVQIYDDEELPTYWHDEAEGYKKTIKENKNEI